MKKLINWFKKIWKQFRCKHEGVTWKVERKNGPRVFRCTHCGYFSVDMFDIEVLYGRHPDGHRYGCKCDCHSRSRYCGPG